jgi:CHAT domain-containing protein
VYLDLGDMDKARSLYFEALTHVDGDRLAEAHVRANLCRWAEVASRPNQEDEVLIRGGLDQCRRALSAFDSVGATDARATVLFLSAQLEWRRGRLEVAEVLASGALSLIESQLPLAGDVDDRTSFLAERQEFYRLLIELRMELHDRQPLAGWDARALEIYELTRARSLLDLLAAESVDPALQLSPELRWAEKEAADRLAARTRGLRARALDEGRPALGGEAELAALEERLAALRHRLEREEPSYLALTQPRPLNVAAIRGLLDDDTLLLALHLGERRAVLWTVNRRKVTGRWLAPRHDLERSAEAWYGLLSDPGWNRTNAPLERRRARRLSELILRPIAEDLARHRRLVFIGDGAFQRLPFGALPSLQSAGEDRPLVMEHEIVQLPSAAVLALLRRMPGRRAEPEKLLVVIADPIYEASDPRLRDAATATRRRSRHRRLRGAAAEAADLADLAGPSRAVLLQGFEARRDQILAGSLKGFSIVHFATHSRTEAAPGRPPGLLLSRLDEHARPIPYVFGLPELYALDLPADMAVLSGCATAIGKEIQGEGLMGLTRGFIHAGTPRVVVSLWSVRDRAARELMRRFYEGLMKHHQPPAEALRRAQVAMREAGWEVRDWAPFVLHGEWKPFALDASLATAAVSDNKTGSERVYKE